MRQYPTMTFQNYIRKYAWYTEDGAFFCVFCKLFVNRHRWTHFKRFHRFKKEAEKND